MRLWSYSIWFLLESFKGWISTKHKGVTKDRYSRIKKVLKYIFLLDISKTSIQENGFWNVYDCLTTIKTNILNSFLTGRNKAKALQYLFASGLLLLSLGGVAQGYTTPADLNGNGTPDYLEAGTVPVIVSHPSSVTICSGDNTSFTASVTGSDLSYQWQVSTDNEVNYSNISVAGSSPAYAGFTSATLSLTNVPVSADGYFYRLIIYEDAFVCDSSITNGAELTVNSTSAPTGSATQTFCTIDNPTVADLSASGTAIQWYTTPTGGTALGSGTALSSGTTYYASQTASGCESDTRFAVAVTLETVSAPTASDQELCAADDPTVDDLVATGTAISWYLTGTGGTALPGSTLLVDNTTYYAEDLVAGCRSPRTGILLTLDTLIDLSCSLPASFNTDASCNYTVPDLSAYLSVTTCGPYTVTQTPTIGTVLTAGYQYFEFLVISGAADSTCGRLINIMDNMAPVISTCADDDVVNADVNCGFPLADYTVELVVTDNCTATGDFVITQTPAPGTQIYASQTISFIVEDEEGNTATCDFALTVIDNGLPPSITCPSDVVVSTDPGSCDATGVALGVPSSTGSCAETEITNDAPATYPLGDTDVTWTMTAEVIPDYLAPEAPDCLPTDVFLSPLNTTGGSLVMEKDVTVINSAGSTLVTDDLSFGSGTLCDGITCTQSGTTAATVAVSTDLGTGVDGLLSNSATLTSDADYSAISLPAGGTLDLNGDLSIKVQTSFDADIGTTLNVNGDVVIQVRSFDLEENFTLNVISGSVTFICQDRFQAHPYCVFNASDPNSIMILSEAWIRFHEQADVQGLLYAVGEIQLKSNSLFTGMMTGNSLQIQQSCVVTGLYPNTCYLDPFSGVPGILNNDSDPTLTLSYPENVTSAVLDYDGIDSDDSEGAGLTWSLSGPDAALFTLDASTGTLTFNSTPDFESPADANGDNVYEVTITLTDTDSQIDSQDLTITVTDVTPIIDTCIQTVTVNDTEAPTLTCPSDILVGTDASSCDAVVIFTAPVATDNCAVLSTVRTDATGLNSGDTFPIGVTTLSYQATDAAGNTSVCSFTVTVSDTEDPIALCQDIDMVLDSLGAISITTAMIDNGSSDNCALDTLFLDQYDFDCSHYGPNTVTLTAVDVNGNSAICTATVNVLDTILPVLDCPSPIIVNATPGQCGAIVNYTVPAVWDNCSTTLVAQEEAGHSPGDFFPVGTTVVGYYAVDPLTGASDSCHFSITVNDTEAPTLTSCPADITVDNPGGCGSVITYVLPTATDNCGVTSFTQIDGTGLSSGSTFPLGVTTLTYRFKDASGNVTLCSFDVTVTDVGGGPSITCPADVIVDNDAGLCSASGVALGMATSSAICGESIITNDAPSIYPVGTTDVTWTLEAEVTPVYYPEPSPDCLPSPVFLSPLNTTGGSLEIAENVQVINTPGNLLTTDNMTIDASSTCDGAPCIQDGNLAQTIVITVDAGDESDGSRNVAGTISTDLQYKDIDLPDGSTLNMVGDVNLRVSEDFRTGQNFTMNIDGDVTIQCDFFDFRKNSQLNILSGSVTFLVESKFDVEENCVFNTDDPNNIVMLCNDVVHFHNGSSATGIFYTNGKIDVMQFCNFEGTLTGYDIKVDNNSIITGLYPNSCFQNPFEANPEILNNESAITYNIAYPELATGMVMNFNGQDTQDEEYNGLTWTLSGSDAASFTMDPDSGFMTFNTIPDFETPGDMNADNSYELLVTLTDSDGNTDTQTVLVNITDVLPVYDTCIQTVTVNDIEAPVAICQPVTLDLGGGSVTLIPSQVNGGSTDNCALNLDSVSPNTFTTVGTYNVTLYVSDDSGNTDNCSVNITVEDNISPVCATQDITVYLDASGTVTIAEDAVDNGSTDNDAIASYDTDITSFDCSELGVNPVVMTLTDLDGNTSACNANVTVLDTISPVAVCQDITVQLDASGNVTITPAMVNAGSTDNCDVTLSLDQTSFDCSQVGDVTVTLTVTDASGNSSTCSATVTIEDTESPTSLCPSDIFVPADSGMSTAVVAYTNPTASDNCSASINQTDATGLSSGSAFPVGMTTVEYTAVDASGNTSICSFDITVTDGEEPVVICSDTTYLAPIGSGGSDVFVVVPIPDAFDNVGIASLTNDFNGTGDASGTYPIGTTLVTWTATDTSGNTSYCTQSVIVLDEESPSIECPGDFLVTAAGDSCEANVSLEIPIATDNDGIASLINDYNGTSDASDIYPVGTTEVTWTATDIHGNTNTCTMDVTVTDNTAPMVVDCTSDIVMYSDSSQCGMDSVLIPLLPPLATDACDSILIINDAPAVFEIGTTMVTWTISDEAGNTSLCSTNVTVLDTIAPAVVECPDSLFYELSISECEIDSASLSLVPPSYNDPCGSAVITNDAPALFPVGETPVLWTISDLSGNSSQCVQVVTVLDTSAATIISCGDSIETVMDESTCGVLLEDLDIGTPLIDDPCGNALISNDAPAVFEVGMTTITWTISDPSGNTATCIQSVEIEDITPPIIVECPVDSIIIVSEADCFTALPYLGEVTVNDPCGEPVITNDAPAELWVGTTEILWTISDSVGNESYCSQWIQVIDDQAPQILDCPADTVLYLDQESCTVDMVLDEPLVSDGCGIDTVLSDAPISFPTGSSIVTWTVTDIGGNSALCYTEVTVLDTISPSVECPTDIELENDPGLCGAEVQFGLPLAEDNCTIDSIILVSEIGSGELFPPGMTDLIYQVQDESGNSASCSFSIEITDTESPVIICPEDILSNDSLVFYQAPDVDDNCIAEAILYSGPASGSYFDHGSTIVSYLASDPSGNVDSCSFQVLVNAPPVAEDDSISIVELNDIQILALIENDFDLDGDSIWIIEVIGGSGSSQLIDGEILYTAEPNTCGPDSLLYVITDEYGALDTASVVISLQCYPEIFIPQGFSPNGDGVNDVFEILGLTQYPENELTIWNRWGHVVYHRVGYENDWAGVSEAEHTIGNTTLPQGTYYYSLKVEKDSPVIRSYFYLSPR